VSAPGAVLDAVFDALANERRREIVTLLAHRPMTTPEVGAHFGFTKQALNRHVGLLEDAGIVSRTLHGRMHDLALVPERLDGVSLWVAELRGGWADFNRLEGVLHARND
jgi:DNA-binding transcriptional ArsR family regulator